MKIKIISINAPMPLANLLRNISINIFALFLSFGKIGIYRSSRTDWLSENERLFSLPLMIKAKRGKLSISKAGKTKTPTEQRSNTKGKSNRAERMPNRLMRLLVIKS